MPEFSLHGVLVEAGRHVVAAQGAAEGAYTADSPIDRNQRPRQPTPLSIANVEARQRDDRFSLLTSQTNRVGEDAGTQIDVRQPDIPVGRQGIGLEKPVAVFEFVRNVLQIRSTLLEDRSKPFGIPK